MLDLIQIREYCLNKPFTTEEFPFNEETLVFKVFGRIFALVDIYSVPLHISLKCNPVLAIQLREQYPFINAGYHMNKKHWNTIFIEDNCNPQFIFYLIDHSYEEVEKKLPKKFQNEIRNNQQCRTKKNY